MIIMKKNISNFLCVVIILLGSNAYADNASQIAAVVGSEAISTLDVRNRALMMLSSMSSSQAAPSQSAIQNLEPQALQSLIDEQLYMQDAVKFKITASESDMAYAIASIEEKNHLQPGGFSRFLEERNVPVETVKEQIRAQVILAKLVNVVIRPKVSLTAWELELAISRTGGDNRELSLKQIFIPITPETPKDEQAKIKAQLSHLQTTAKGCEHFDAEAVAENPLLAPTSLTVNTENLNPEIRAIISDLAIGYPSPLLQNSDSMQLLMVCKKSASTITEAQRKKLSDILLQQKVELRTKQYLRDLRRQTYVEIRMP